MIVSKAMRNIRQKIDWTASNSVNIATNLWQYDYGVEARDERLDYPHARAQDVYFVSVTGGTIADDDWHSLFGSLGDSFPLSTLTTNLKTLRPDITLTGMNGVQACARVNQESTGRYLTLDFTYSNQIGTADFSSILVGITNQFVSTISTSTQLLNFFELGYQDLLNMGVPLVNNGNGTYKINTGVDRLRIKISEDV